MFVYVSPSCFTKFYLLDIFENKLVECTEKDFDDIVIKFRHLYEVEYDGANAQNFLIGGVIQARRER